MYCQCRCWWDTYGLVQNCREEYGEHTCDKRKSRSFIQSEFPQFELADSFTEQDQLWTTDRELKEHVTSRAKDVLDRIFNADVEQCAFPCYIHIFILMDVQSYRSQRMEGSLMRFWELSGVSIMPCRLEVCWVFFWFTKRRWWIHRFATCRYQINRSCWTI